jgi:hypothetical protein
MPNGQHCPAVPTARNGAEREQWSRRLDYGVMRLRRWFRAYLVAPFGSIVAQTLNYVLYAASRDVYWYSKAMSASAFDARATAVMLGVGLLISYAVGLLLFPVYALCERLGLRGWHVYVPIAVAAGALTAIGMEYPRVGEGTIWNYWMYLSSGLFCGAVFSAVMRESK